jgi:cysteine-rich repeat protein
VPEQGEGAVCVDAAGAAQHAWAQAAQRIIYVSPTGTGDGASPEAPASLAGALSDEAAEATAVILAPGTYDGNLAIGGRGPISVIGPCARNATLTASAGSVLTVVGATAFNLYGVSLRGAAFDDAVGLLPALAITGVDTLAIEQTRFHAPGGEAIALSASGATEARLRGLTFEGVAGAAIRSADALGTWTVDCSVFAGPIGGDGFVSMGGDAQTTLARNRFEQIAGSAILGRGPLGTWTVDCSVFAGPIGEDGVAITGGAGGATMHLTELEFERISGDAIAAQGALGTWTVDCSVFRGPIGGAAMRFFGQSGAVTLYNNQVTGAATGIAINGGSATWTLTDNSIQGSAEGGPSPGMSLTDLSSEAAVTISGMTIDQAIGAGMEILRSAAELEASGSTFSGTYDDRGGEPTLNSGVGIAVVDSTGVTLIGLTVQNNATAGVLFDLGGWGRISGRQDLTGNADNRVRGTAEISGQTDGEIGSDIVIQNIPEGSSPRIEANPSTEVDNRPAERALPVERAQPLPPRCGDGVRDAGEDCDDGNTANDDGCSAACHVESGFRRIAMGPRFGCALSVAGGLYCFGRNDSNVVSPEPIPFAREPQPRGNIERLRQVSAGNAHACALDEAGRMSCWGQHGSDGRLGHGVGNDLPNLVPARVELVGGANLTGGRGGAAATAMRVWELR